MLKRNWVSSSSLDDVASRLFMARLNSSVSVSRNHRVRLAQGIGTVCRQVMLSYLDDEQRTISGTFAKGKITAGFTERQSRARKLTDKLAELDPTQDTGLDLLRGIVNTLEEYVGWEENVLYPCIDQMVKDKNSQMSVDEDSKSAVIAQSE